MGIAMFLAIVSSYMATCNFNTSSFQSPKPLLLHVFMITILFYRTIPFINALSFNFDSFITNDPNIEYQNDSYAADQAIELTRNLADQVMSASFGRAIYNKPLHLWDNATGNLTDFTTHFVFVINSQGRTSYGDGLAFFLAPQGSKIPPNVTQGSTLGLSRNNEQANTTDNKFVAVEFDIYTNWFDPPNNHVGIDINNMVSVSNVTWRSNITGGAKHEVWISYNSSTHNLSVVFTGFTNNTPVNQYLSQIVDLKQSLPDWVTFGFSASTGSAYAIHRIYSWEFSSSLEIGDNPVAVPPSPNPNGGRRRKNKTGLAVGLSVGGSVLVGGLVLVFLAIMHRKRKGGYEEDGHVLEEYMDDEFERGTGPKKFSYNELCRATNNFKEDEKLGEGGFGGVYRGFLKDMNSYIAVKRVSKGSKQGMKEYASEVKIISRLRHKNLVQLVGWCHEKKELLLVYEFMPNGSLDSHLFKEKTLLTWEVRYKIAQGLASGLLYLHEEWEQCVVHRDIKASNIMLDSNFSAKLGDFGLARLVDHGKGSQTTVLAGTMGYMAPECIIEGKSSKESDVYSFGVVALEIACGRKPISPKAEEGQVVMLEWVWDLYGSGELLKASDQRLCGDFDDQQMERLMMVGLWSAHPDENLRPSIRQAIQVLNFEAPLPILSSKRPVPTYAAPPASALRSSLSLSYCNPEPEGGQNQSSSYSYNTNSSQFTTSSAASSASASLLYTR